MNKYVAPLVLAIILIVAIAWNAYNQAAPPRILEKFFGIPQDSPLAQLVLVMLVVVVIAIGYAVARRK